MLSLADSAPSLPLLCAPFVTGRLEEAIIELMSSIKQPELQEKMCRSAVADPRENRERQWTEVEL